MKNYPYFIMIFLTLGIVTIMPVSTQQKTTNKHDQELSKINKSLESLEIYLRNSNYIKACNQAIESASLIDQEIDNLKFVEPNYNWQEIKNVLLELPIKYCSEKNKIIK